LVSTGLQLSEGEMADSNAS